MNKLTHSDLIFHAKQLPKVEPFDHEDAIISCYKYGKWESVDKYSAEIHRIASLESRRDTIYQKIIKWLAKTRKFLIRATNSLKQIEIR